jgi:hypothetical protein
MQRSTIVQSNLLHKGNINLDLLHLVNIYQCSYTLSNTFFHHTL